MPTDPNNHTSPNTQKGKPRNTLASTRPRNMWDILLMAGWFGLVTGLIEGLGFLLFQKLDWLHWKMALLAVSIEIIWISALFDLLLFGALGAALVIVARLLPWLPVQRYAAPLFVFAAFTDWLGLTGRIYPLAALILAAGLVLVFFRWFEKHEAAAYRFWRKSLPWLGGITLVALIGIQSGLGLRERFAVTQLPPVSPGSPNILVIVVDTLRADHLSSYGYGRATSPTIDRVAQQGVLFENAFATSPWTLPSHASLVTGRFTHEHGAENRRLDNGYPTIAEALRARGYRTGAFSGNYLFFNRRWGFGRGFIRFEDYFHSVGDMAARTFYGRALDRFVLRRLGFEDYPARKRAAHINRSVLRWIERDREKPFFAFLNYFDVHDPYLPPQPYRGQFSELESPGGILSGRMQRFDPLLTSAQAQSELDAYDGAIAYVDDQIGQLLNHLEERGLAETTLVVITSDHGESFGEHGLFLHQNALWRQEIHVPLIFWLPGQVPASQRVTQPVTIAALPATLMEVVGASDQEMFPGPSLAQLWNAQEIDPEWPDPLAEMSQLPCTEHIQRPVCYGWSKSLVSPEWHYIEHETLGIELYDWNDDPKEMHNLAENRETRMIIEQFRSSLEMIVANAPVSPD